MTIFRSGWTLFGLLAIFVLLFLFGGPENATDVALIHGGVPEVSAELTIDYGLPIHLPMVDVRTVEVGVDFQISAAEKHLIGRQRQHDLADRLEAQLAPLE